MLKTQWRETPDGKERHRVTTGIEWILGQHANFRFSLETERRQGQRWAEGGWGRDEDLVKKYFPELLELSKWSTCDEHGTPMHYMENSTYWFKEALDKLNDDKESAEQAYAHFRNTCLCGTLPDDNDSLDWCRFDKLRDCRDRVGEVIAWLSNRLPKLQAMFKDLIAKHGLFKERGKEKLPSPQQIWHMVEGDGYPRRKEWLEYPKADDWLSDVIKVCGLAVKDIVVVPENPTMYRSSKEPEKKSDSIHYHLTLVGPKGEMTLYFTMGSGHRMRLSGSTSDDREGPRPPNVRDVVHALLSDTESINACHDFEDWADEMGFDSDSRSAERTYNICLEQDKKLHRILGKQYAYFIGEENDSPVQNAAQHDPGGPAPSSK